MIGSAANLQLSIESITDSLNYLVFRLVKKSITLSKIGEVAHLLFCQKTIPFNNKSG